MSRLVDLSNYYDLAAAVVHRSILDQHGIPAFLFDRHMGGISWIHLPALGGIRIMVPENDVAAAREILGDLSNRIETPDAERCPNCNSDDVFRPSSWIAGLATVALLGAPLLLKSRRRHCRTCHRNWRGSDGLLL